MDREYDVVVVGGGIHGVGVAQAAAAGGYSVLLLEQNALASGTSSRSSKLIHGGLRYLENPQFSLVRESLHERRLLLKLAPDIVRLVPFYIPVYKTTHRRSWQIRLGLSLYGLLGGMRSDNRFSSIPKSAWNNLDGIETRNLESIFCYQDGQTDDVVLTHAVMHSAQTFGADLAMPAVLTWAVVGTDSVQIEYEQNGTLHTCSASVLVNAGGPWVNQILEKITPAPPMIDIDLVRGTHIRVGGSMQAGNYYMEAPQDGRAVFAMPREGAILVGTTEAIFNGEPAAVEPTLEERQYLLEVLSHYFPYFRSSQQQDILSSFAGLRVLPKGQGRAFQRTRETIFLTNRDQQPRLLSIYGGKLTTWRATAAKVIARLAPALPSRRIRARTDQIMLSPD